MTPAAASPESPGPAFELVLVGGGLQNALIALAVLRNRPDAAIAVIESADRIGGNHTWSFHSGDVPASARALVEPLVVNRWAGYDVAFPGLERRLEEPYATISSDRLAAVVTARLGAAPNARLLTGARASSVGATSVALDDGRTITGEVVIDARGPGRVEPTLARGYQKFVGLELDLEEDAERTLPLLMDARVPQTDGFRFFYVLPLGPRRVLVEDTYFSDSPELDVDRIRGEILVHARSRGLAVRDIRREERGVLPLPTRGMAMPAGASPLVAGYAGGWFHPATGYSFPVALRLALHVARTATMDTLFDAEWAELCRAHERQFRFGTLLNRLLFSVFDPEDRWNALARFYRMPEGTIRRFYALDTTHGDRLRLLCGSPPRKLSMRAALSRGAFA